tara:strand:+ start:208 stop:453 length:246 start_codon:yes stop_codon:yes gene_type:complete
MNRSEEVNDYKDSEIILKHHIKVIEDKLKESEEIIERQKRINERVVNNYEYLDQEYDKVYSLLTEDQKNTLNIKLDRSLRN